MKKILNIFSILFVAIVCHAQTNSENYIQSTNCLDSTCIKKIETVQYFDFLGRPKQVISVKSSPTGKDIVTPIVYDELGRQTREYLPVPQSSTANGNIYPQVSGVSPYPVLDATNFYAGEKTYTEKTLENSPLERVLQQKQVGNAWTDKPITFGYDLNNQADHVKKYQISTLWNSTEKYYSGSIGNISEYLTAQLVKNSVTDEDGNTTIEFKDGSGQTVLIRKVINASQNADTYYVYNDYKQLAFVIPPLASVLGTIPEATLDNLCYQYRYDSKNRLVEKKIPGKSWEFMVYDKQNRLVLAQDANLRSTTNNFNQKGWTFTKYDQFGRIVYSGFFANTATRIAMQTALNNMVANAGNNEKREDTTPIVQNGENIYYTKNAFPTGSTTILSVNYYDTYPILPAEVIIPSIISGQKVLKQPGQSTTGKNTRTLPLASHVRNIEDNNWTKGFSYYDEKGRVIGTYSINHLGGHTKTESELDFAGVPQKVNTFHVRKPNEEGVIIKERFVYDNQNRLFQHYHQVDSNTEQLLTQNEYNELSQLKNKKVGNNLQSIDYAYNIRGWMTDINKDQMSLPDLGGKLFSYKIKYTQKEGIENPDPTQFSGKNVKAKYNGYITEVDWRAVETIGVNPSITPKRYGYAYDGLNRLSAGYYQNPDNPYSKENTESLDYDVNGNISKLYRTSVLESGTNTATVIDNLGYVYGTGGNQVTIINDVSQNPTGYEGGGSTITYDLNGNMTTMPDKGISTIKYNYLDLPNNLVLNKIGSENVTVNTRYSANGTKLVKESTAVLTGVSGSTTTKKTTDYIDGFQYLKTENFKGGGGAWEILEATSLSSRAMQPQVFSLDRPIDPIDPTIDPPFGGGGGIIVDLKTPDLQFFPTAEGFYDYQKDQYIYQYVDHLGNVRVSFARNSAGALEITDNNDYYPFGMNHLKTGNAYFGQGSYKSYKYNGKELQEIGMYSYGWREYMPDIGRWNGMDQLSESYSSASPYAYVLNNPVNMIDPDGRFSMQTFTSNIMSFASGTTFSNNNDGSWSINGSSMAVDDNGTLIKGRSAGIIDIPGITMKGHGNNSTWNNLTNLGYNSFLMSSKMTGAQGQWNFDRNNGMLSDAIENTKVGQSVSAAENFLFLELPGTMLGGELLSAGWRAAGLSRYICGPLGRVSNGLLKICFTEGTLVSVEKGNKKIEDIKEGDLVWSYNEETGKKELKKVVELSRNTSSSLVKISVNGTEITCTPEHPFYVNGNWVEAKNLTKGSLLTTLDGTTSPIESINFLDEKVKVYNFEVEGNHNYYVSEKGILVHNTCWTERLGMFMEYAANIETKSLTSQKATVNHLENVFKMLDKTRTDGRILKFVADDMGNVEFVGKGVMKISQKNAGDATFVYPNGGFQIFQKGKIVINKIK